MEENIYIEAVPQPGTVDESQWEQDAFDQAMLDPDYKKQIDKKMLKTLATKLGFVLLIYLGIREFSSPLIKMLINWDYLSVAESIAVARSLYILIVIGVLLISVLGLVIPFYILKKITKKESLKITDSFDPQQGKLSAIGISLGTMTLGQIMAGAFAAILLGFGIGITTQIGDISIDTATIVILIIEVVLIPALFEELVFRKYLLNSLRRFSDGFALVVSSAIFGLIHINGSAWIYAFVLGLVLGYYALKTGSIKTSILIHGICNLISVIITIVSQVADVGVSSIVTISFFAASAAIGLVAAVISIKKNGYIFGKLSDNGNSLDLLVRIKTVVLNPLVIGALCVMLWLTVKTLFVI